MSLETFDLDALSRIDDERIRVAFEQALRRCILDCEDRPALNKERKINLTVKLTPTCDETGGIDDVVVAFAINETLPRRQSATYTMKARRGQLVFNEFAPEDADQRTFDELGPRKVGGE
jgi:hypothetical protein